MNNYFFISIVIYAISAGIIFVMFNIIRSKSKRIKVLDATLELEHKWKRKTEKTLMLLTDIDRMGVKKIEKIISISDDGDIADVLNDLLSNVSGTSNTNRDSKSNKT